MSTLVLPGDLIPLPSTSTSSSEPSTSYSITFGPGIGSSSRPQASSSSNGGVTEPRHIATKMGDLHSTGKRRKMRNGGVEEVKRLYVEVDSKRYVPTVGEDVIGIVMLAHKDGFRVDIGGSQSASLGALAFEGATKKLRPRLEPGSIIKARVTIANRDMEPEITCFNRPSEGKNTDDGYGEVKGGLVVGCSLGLCRDILTTPLIPTLASLFSPSQTIEISPSLNGRLWIQCPQSVVTVISLKRILEAVDEGLVGREVGELREWCGREGVVLT